MTLAQRIKSLSLWGVRKCEGMPVLFSVERSGKLEREERMNRIAMCLLFASVIMGCATTPSPPAPHPSKYAFQCFFVSVPEEVLKNLNVRFDKRNLGHDPTMDAMPRPTQTQIDEIIKHREVEIVELPIVYAGMGEAVANDQTITSEMAVDADVVDGEVVYRTESCKIGNMVSVDVKSLERGYVSYQIHAMTKRLAGYDHRKTLDGMEVRMPYFDRRELNTTMSQKGMSKQMIFMLTV